MITRNITDHREVISEVAPLSESTLVIISRQNEIFGSEHLSAREKNSLFEIELLLERSRALASPVIHLIQQQTGGNEKIVALDNYRTKYIERLSPQRGEPVVTKNLPNGFNNPEFSETLSWVGRTNLVIVGYKSHTCVCATARAALDNGYRSALIASATEANDMIDPLTGSTVAAELIKQVSLTEINNNYAKVLPDSFALPD